MVLNGKDLHMVNLQRCIIGTLAVVGMLIIGILPAFSQGAVDPASIRIPSEYGRVEEIWAPVESVDRVVIVFGEQHDLISARENIARMLEYLHQEYQISFVGLEATPNGKQVDTSNFRTLPEFEGLEELKKEMAWALLDDGEINPYEYMGITYGIAVYGVEDWGLYSKNLEMSESIDWDAFVTEEHRLLIQAVNALLKKLREQLQKENYRADLEQLNNMISQFNKLEIVLEEFLQHVFGIDSDEVFGEFKNVWEEWSTPLSSIKTEKAFHAYLKSEYPGGFSSEEMPEIVQYDQYLNLAEDRGRAMADNLVSLIGRVGGEIAILGVGAGHTEVLQELKEKNVPYIFVLPRGLATLGTQWEEEAYHRSTRSAPLPFSFGDWLPKELMGQIRVDQLWFKTKVETLYTALVASYLQAQDLANVGKSIDAAFRQYGRSSEPFWNRMEEIDGDLYLPFEANDQVFVVRVTRDEIDYTADPVFPVLAHGRITGQDFYQIIDHNTWQNETERQQVIDRFTARRADKKLLDQFQTVYTLVQNGKSPEEITQAVKENLPAGYAKEFDGDSIFPTGTDVYGFYQDHETGERHFIRLTEEPYRAWAEPTHYIQEHGPVAGTLRYEELDILPFLNDLDQDTRQAVLNDQLSLAKLDARLRSLSPTSLLLSVKVRNQEAFLLTVMGMNSIKVLDMEEGINKLLEQMQGKMAENPVASADDLLGELSDEEMGLIRDKLVLPLVAHLWIDRSNSEVSKIMLDLSNDYRDFLILDLPNDPVLRTIIPYFLRDNRVVYITESSTARDIEKALRLTIDHHRVTLFISKPLYGFCPNWDKQIASLEENITARGLGIKLIDLTTLAQEDPEEAKQILRRALGEEDSLVLAFGHIPGSKALDLGGGEESEFTQGEIPEFERLIRRFAAFLGCKSYAAGWSDTIISRKAAEVSLGFREEFNPDMLFKFLNGLVDELGKDADLRPRAIQLFLDIVEKLGIPANATANLPVADTEIG